MQMQVKHKRKDGKFSVILSYRNGVRLNKIVTREQYEELKQEVKESNQ